MSTARFSYRERRQARAQPEAHRGCASEPPSACPGGRGRYGSVTGIALPKPPQVVPPSIALARRMQPRLPECRDREE